MDKTTQTEIWWRSFQESREKLLSRLPVIPELAFTLGSGLGGAIDGNDFQIESEFSFSELAFQLNPGVEGHAGKWIVGRFKDQEKPILIQSGRLHPYEGWSELECFFSYALLASVGVRSWVFTNAVGGIAPDLGRGDWLVIRDHINGMGWNPLRGVGKLASFLRPWIPDGCRSVFVDMTRAYDEELTQILSDSVKIHNPSCRTGVYYGVMGPSYETPAEIQMMKNHGADVVGMSLVSEAITARYLGIKVAALSSVTNAAAGMGGGDQSSTIDHLDVLSAGQELAPQAGKIIHGFAKRYFGAMNGGLNFT